MNGCMKEVLSIAYTTFADLEMLTMVTAWLIRSMSLLV